MVNIVVQPGDFSGTDNGDFIICGLVGVAGFVSVPAEKAFKNMLIFDSVRGTDSTGVASVHNNGDVSVAKELGDPFMLFPTKEYKDTMKYFSRVLIGHNRAATFGGISRETAHPFEFNTLVGVHNGTLKSKHRLEDSHLFKVDSENLYHHMEKKGLPDLMEYMDGAWALVWWDKVKETLHFLRNKERPIWLATSPDGKTLFWASEPWMITAACVRNGVSINDPFSLEVDSHFAVNINGKGIMAKPHIAHMPSKYKVPVFFTNGGGNNWQALPPANGNIKPQLKLITKAVESQSSSGAVSFTTIQGYVGRKNVKMEVVGSTIDMHGARHYNLMDLFEPDLPIRLYTNRRDRTTIPIGSIVSGNIAGWIVKKNGESFFKVNANSYEIIVDAAVEDKRYDDGKGHLLSKKDWEEKFSNCSWCFDHLYAEDHGNRLTDTGDCVCGKCATITDVRTTFNLKAVY